MVEPPLVPITRPLVLIHHRGRRQASAIGEVQTPIVGLALYSASEDRLWLVVQSVRGSEGPHGRLNSLRASGSGEETHSHYGVRGQLMQIDFEQF